MTLLLSLLACETDIPVDQPGDEEEDTAVDTISPPGDSDETGVPLIHASISGSVMVGLSTVDAQGHTTTVSWEDANGGVWAYGSLFVGAYIYDENHEAEWIGHQTITSPTVDGNDYTFELELPEDTDVWVSAWVDFWGDGIIGSTDPSANYPRAVTLSDGDAVSGIDLTIWSTLPISSGGEDTSTYITLSGELYADGDYDGFPCRAMIYDTADEGPYFYTSADMVDAGDGSGLGDWALPAYANWGQVKLVGGCDVGSDGLLDPSDQWGGLADGGVDKNPLTIGDEDDDNLRIVVPFDGFRPYVAPSVAISGNVVYEGGYDTLDPEGVLHVVALRAAPNQEFNVSDLDYEYAVQHISVADVTGTEAAFRLPVPSDTTVYLWAFLDADGDGLLNEPDEMVGSADGGAGGAVTVGKTSPDPITFGITEVAG